MVTGEPGSLLLRVVVLSAFSPIFGRVVPPPLRRVLLRAPVQSSCCHHRRPCAGFRTRYMCTFFVL